jgi:F420-dependent hydroxymycolic acid dehydrogenase
MGGDHYSRRPEEEAGDGMSRRRFSALGAAALCGAGLRPGARRVSPTPGGRSGAPVGIALAHEQFPTPDIVRFAELAELAELADRAGFGYVWTSG